MEHVIEETVQHQHQRSSSTITATTTTTTTTAISLTSSASGMTSPTPQQPSSSASSFYSTALSFFPSLSNITSTNSPSTAPPPSLAPTLSSSSSATPPYPSTSFSAPPSLHSSLDNLNDAPTTPVPIAPRSTLRPPSPAPSYFNNLPDGSSPQLSPFDSPLGSPSSSPPGNFSTLYSFEQNDALLSPVRTSVSSPVVSFSANIEEEYWAFFTTVAQLPYLRRKAPPPPARASVAPPAETSALTTLIKDFASASVSNTPSQTPSPAPSPSPSPTPSPRKSTLPEIIQTPSVSGPSSAPLGHVVELGVSPSSTPPVGYVPYPMPSNGGGTKYSAPFAPAGATPLIIAPPPVYPRSTAPRGHTTIQIHSCLYKRKGEKGYSLTQKAATALLRRYIGVKSDLPAHAPFMEVFRARVAPFFDAFSPKTSKILKVYVLSHVFTATAENDACGHVRFEISIPDEDVLEYVEHQRQREEALSYNQEDLSTSNSSGSDNDNDSSAKQAVEAHAVEASSKDLLTFPKDSPSSSSSTPSTSPLPSESPSITSSSSSIPALEINSLTASYPASSPQSDIELKDLSTVPLETQKQNEHEQERKKDKQKEKEKKKEGEEEGEKKEASKKSNRGRTGRSKSQSAPKSYHWMEFQVNNPYKNQFFPARVQLLMKEGLSVISDIDDTIKESGVLHKKELMRNTFVKPYAPVEGMAKLYRLWEQRYGCSFHYVSASPWGLYGPLNEFISKYNFPEGTFHLRQFGWNDSSFLDMFSSSQLRLLKYTAIQTLFQQFPFRHFLLVGDSGESDPEIYGEIARQFPGQVAGIFIRELNPAQPRINRERECAAWFHLPFELCHIFYTPSKLESWQLDGRIAAHLFPQTPTYQLPPQAPSQLQQQQQQPPQLQQQQQQQQHFQQQQQAVLVGALTPT